MNTPSTPSENIVKLDVGGMIFKTTKSTLKKFDAMFRTMFETNVSIEKDESGNIFIDRPPKHFELILNYMRDGEVDLPNSEDQLREIRREAQFYLLTDLVDLCSASIPDDIPKKVHFIETDNEFVRLSTKIEKPVIFIHYKLGKWEKVFCSFNASVFVEKYKHQFDIYFKSFQIGASLWTASFHDKTRNFVSPGKDCQDHNDFLVWMEQGIEHFLSLPQ